MDELGLPFVGYFALVEFAVRESRALFGSEPAAIEPVGPAAVSRRGSVPSARLALVGNCCWQARALQRLGPLA